MRIDIPNAIRLNRKRFEANICARYLIWNKEVINFSNFDLIKRFNDINGYVQNRPIHLVKTQGYWRVLKDKK